MAKSRFYFHLFEVTIVQMLKAHGFDKANNQHVLEVFTDIAVRYFNLLVRTVIKFMELRDDCYPNIKDITLAFLELKVISPHKELDKYDIDPLTNTGIENFEKWFNDDMNTRMREVARPTRELLELNKKAKLQLQNVSSKMDNLTKALDEQAKQAQLQNPTMPYLPPPSVSSTKQTPTPYNMYTGMQPFPQVDSQLGSSFNTHEDQQNELLDGHHNGGENPVNGYEIPPSAIDDDWIQYLIRDQIATHLVTNGLHQQNQPTQTANGKLIDNHHLKPALFKDTVLYEYIPDDLRKYIRSDLTTKNDFLIAGPMPERLLHTFPYYKSDDESDYLTGDEDDSDNESDPSGEDGDDENVEDRNIHGDNNDTANKTDADKHTSSGLAAYDYYEHHKLYEDEMEDLDLYGQGDSAASHDLNLFG